MTLSILMERRYSRYGCASLITMSTTYFQIEFIGEIIEVNETATAITYKIDDRTGPLVEVRKWVDDQVSTKEHSFSPVDDIKLCLWQKYCSNLASVILLFLSLLHSSTLNLFQSICCSGKS